MSPWHARPADDRQKVAALEKLDRFAPLRNKLRMMAGKAGEWAGIPLPLDGESLVIEPSYPFAQFLNKPEPAIPDDVKFRNRFRSTRRQCNIYVYEEAGKIKWGYEPAVHHFRYDLQTLGCSDAWGVEQEGNAVHLLGTLVRHHTFKQYLMTGMFLETSARSRVTYMFRRLKPTVAMVAREGEMVILTALCMHPIAYYKGSWAGAMCPTDDVIAHLMLMRGDEPMFWRRCAQHPPGTPEAGL